MTDANANYNFTNPPGGLRRCNDVYLGTLSSLPPPAAVSNTAGTFFTPSSPLLSEKEALWRVVAKECYRPDEVGGMVI